MYADRYAKTGIKPGALSVAIGLNGAVLAALMFASPAIVPEIGDAPFETRNIPIPPDPPVIPDIKPEAKVEQQNRAIDPPPLQQPAAFDPVKPTTDGYVIPPGPTGMDGGVPGGTGTIPEAYVAPHVPVITGVQLDSAFSKFFQPAYPPSESRAGREGRVTVRVLVGTDGRVKQVELVTAASDQFFEATKRQALSNWRFKPAMRDGVPQEGWRTMSVSFVLNGDE